MNRRSGGFLLSNGITGFLHLGEVAVTWHLMYRMYRHHVRQGAGLWPVVPAKSKYRQPWPIHCA